MDWWDASPFTVAQLPFHGMSNIPIRPNEKFPDDRTRIRLSVELERPLRFRRSGALVSLQLSRRCPQLPPKTHPPDLSVRSRLSQRIHDRSRAARPAVRSLNCCRRQDLRSPNWPKRTSARSSASTRNPERASPISTQSVRPRASPHEWRHPRERGPLLRPPVTVKSSIATRGYQMRNRQPAQQGRRPARRRRRRRPHCAPRAR
jgi:hypothetical protein